MGLIVHEPASWEFRCQECGKWFDKKESRIPFTETSEDDTGEYELLYCQPNYYGDRDLYCPFRKTTNYFCK